MEPLMTIREVQAITRLSKSKIYVLKDKGILRPTKLQGTNKVLFSADEVRRYIESGRQPSAN